MSDQTTLLPDEDEFERRRLDALHDLQVLDTPPDPRFDALTRLAQRLFAVPMVSLTLVDRDRQWRKSFQGDLRREEPRRDSFCGDTIRSSDPLLVADATTDERYRRNPFVTGDPHLRFYAGQPVHAPTGEPIGTLCLMDTEPRSLSESEQAILADLGRYVENELAHDAEMERATEVQQALLPRRPSAVPGWDLGASLVAARRVGGDFYDWYPVHGGAVLTLADVMGKGMGAAILAATARAVLRSASRTAAPPAQALAEAAEVLAPDLAESWAFVTVFHALLGGAGDVRFADAGHGLSLVVRGYGGFERLETPDLPIGIGGGGFEERRLSLAPGDALVTFSDGLLDVLGDPDRVAAQVADLTRGAASAPEAARAVLALVPAEAQADDVTVVVARRDRA